MTEIVKERVGMRKIKNRDVVFDGGRAALLDDGALMEVLLRLPVKSVIRFQSVSKSWLSLISSDHFRRLHTLRRHKPPPSLILDSNLIDQRMWGLFYSNPKRSEKLTKMMMIPPFDTNCFEIKSCSNGLVLMKCDKNYYVYNPTTKQSKKLSLAHNDKFIEILSIRLLFDPSKSLHYNIVCIRMEIEPLHQIEVFSSESGMWRVCVEPFTIYGKLLHNLGSCVRHKSFIFLINPNRDPYFNYVYCFDIVKNVSELVVCPLPKLAQVQVYYCSNSIQESNGCLYYCALFEDRPCKSSAGLWKLRVNMDDPRCSEWEKMYCHRVCLLDGQCFRLRTFVVETGTMLISSSRNIVAYHFRSKTYKDVLESEHELGYVNIFKFGETLALL